MKKYIVEYSLPYKRIVRVGVAAESKRAAIAVAKKAFDDGTIWDDAEAMPLLYDDFEEEDHNPNSLEFTAQEVDEWPESNC